MLQDKAIARKNAYKLRAEAHKNIAANIEGFALEAARGYDIVAAYMPIRSEIDPLPAMHTLIEAGHRLVVPVIIGEAQPLEFLEWTPDHDMIEGAFGAMIPKARKALTPDLVLAPLVAFDARGTRLGYGGGFYDRTLEKLRKHAATPYIGLAYSAQKLSTLPREKTDIPLDGVITEAGFTPF